MATDYQKRKLRKAGKEWRRLHWLKRMIAFAEREYPQDDQERWERDAYAQQHVPFPEGLTKEQRDAALDEAMARYRAMMYPAS
jgi:hypothetical protein